MDWVCAIETSFERERAMNPLQVLKDELTFLQKHLPELESSSDLAHVAVEFKKRIDTVGKQIKDLEGDA
jgi:hypothetical protein